MMKLLELKTALLSSYAKDEHCLRLARCLRDRKWNLLGSSGTAKFLESHGIRCTDIATIVGEPILNHRVVTLSRELHAGLLAATPADFEELGKLHISPVGLVYVTLYPLEQTIKAPGSTPQEVLEQTDVGGVALLHAAAKGQRIVVCSEKQIEPVIAMLERGKISRGQLLSLMAAAEYCASKYLKLSGEYWRMQYLNA